MKIYPTIGAIVDADRYMEAALVREQGLLIVWGEDAESCISRARELSQQMIQPFIEAMNPINIEKDKAQARVAVSEVNSPTFAPGGFGEGWLEEASPEPARRPVLIQATQTGLTMLLLIVALGSGWQQISIELYSDQNWIRLAFLVVLPFQFWLALVS